MSPDAKRCKHGTSTDELRRLVNVRRHTRQIAAEFGVTERTVRNRLHRAGIPLPSELKAANVDLGAVFADYRAGTPVATIAERHGISAATIKRLVEEHGVERDVPLQRNPPPPRYAKLADRRWLLEQLANGRSAYAVARELRTGHRTVQDALRRHGITWPPPDADPVDRLAYIDDDEIRVTAAQRIIDQATALAKRARAVRDDTVSRRRE